MNKVKVTVLMPAYNAAAYIGEAIRSVLEQTFTSFELLIIDDGSTDDTIALIKKITDPRVNLVEEPHRGIAASLNKGLTIAKGEYIARFDADDICLPQRLEKQLNFLEQHPEYVLTGCDAEYIAANNEHLFNFECIGHSHEHIIARLYEYCPFIHSGVMYKKTAVIEAGGYSPHAHNFEDYFLWIRLIKYGKFHNIPEQLMKVRFNPESATIDEKWRPHRFRQLKRNAIQNGMISKKEGDEILSIIKKQDVHRLKKGAYYALCGKKFLVNNHQPSKARNHLAKAIRYYPLRADNYALYLLSYLPQPLLLWLHRQSPNKI